MATAGGVVSDAELTAAHRAAVRRVYIAKAEEREAFAAMMHRDPWYRVEATRQAKRYRIAAARIDAEVDSRP